MCRELANGFDEILVTFGIPRHEAAKARNNVETVRIIGRLQGRDGHVTEFQYCETSAGFQDAEKLLQHTFRVFDVFKNLRVDDDIVGIVLFRDVLKVAEKVVRQVGILVERILKIRGSSPSAMGPR